MENTLINNTSAPFPTFGTPAQDEIKAIEHDLPSQTPEPVVYYDNVFSRAYKSVSNMASKAAKSIRSPIKIEHIHKVELPDFPQFTAFAQKSGLPGAILDSAISFLVTIHNAIEAFQYDKVLSVKIIGQHLLATGIIRVSNVFHALCVKLYDLVTFFQNKIDTMTAQGDGDSDDLDCDDRNALESIFKSLFTVFISGSAPEFEAQAKTNGPSFSGLVNSMKTVKTFGQCIEYFAKYLWICISTIYFWIHGKPLITGDNQLLVERVVEWMKLTTNLISQFDAKQDDSKTLQFANTIIAQYTVGTNLSIQLVKSGFTQVNFTSFYRMMTSLTVVYEHALLVLSTSNVRKVPLMFQLNGLPNQGKTVAMQMLIYHLYNLTHDTSVNPGSNQILYERRIENEYWDGYMNQWAVTMDDFFQADDRD
jgi:hypothetical protein